MKNIMNIQNNNEIWVISRILLASPYKQELTPLITFSFDFRLKNSNFRLGNRNSIRSLHR